MHVDSDLSAYLDGELAPAERARVDAHLNGCDRCRGRLGELGATASLIAALPSPRPARSLVPRVVERYNWLRPLRSFSTFATGAFLMVFLVTAVGRSGSGLGGGPEVPFGRTTGVGAPAAAPAPAATAAAPGAAPAGDTAVRAFTPSPALLAPAEQKAAQATSAPAPPAAFSTSTQPPRAESAGSPQAELASRDAQREPPPLTDPRLWLGFAVLAAVIAIYAHWRLRST